uniref:Uncharacterized protein n=1 Tax=Lotharella oceanica TaxID=641309 RepID=A0A7S2TZN4_9EUKA|mmetsp:Transcript_34938/g.64698  ORF Transcript_34938/g.64698 Transcript_34938/m.64698 type:complete len:119 (+) Transcript_34938:257-613(+)
MFMIQSYGAVLTPCSTRADCQAMNPTAPMTTAGIPMMRHTTAVPKHMDVGRITRWCWWYCSLWTRNMPLQNSDRRSCRPTLKRCTAAIEYLRKRDTTGEHDDDEDDEGGKDDHDADDE